MLLYTTTYFICNNVHRVRVHLGKDGVSQGQDIIRSWNYQLQPPRHLHILAVHGNMQLLVIGGHLVTNLQLAAGEGNRSVMKTLLISEKRLIKYRNSLKPLCQLGDVGASVIF